MPTAADPLLLERQLYFPLYAAANLVVRAYGPLLRPLGLTYPQYLVMLVLWEAGELGVGELGERLHLDSGTLTPLLKRMEAAGLVARRRDSADERRVRVSPTARGRALKARARAVPEALACRFAADTARLAALRDEIKGLVALLAAPPPPASPRATPRRKKA